MKLTLESIIDQLTAEAYANIGKQFSAIADAHERIQEAITLAEVLESVDAQVLTTLHPHAAVWVCVFCHKTNEEVMAAIAAARLEATEDITQGESPYSDYRIAGFQVPLSVRKPIATDLKLAA